jgi:hypothetical protein
MRIIQKTITLLEVTLSYISVPINIALLKFALLKVSDKVKPEIANLKKVHNCKYKYQKVHTSKLHSFKEFNKNCIPQVFSDTIQKCISSNITQLKCA